MALFPLFIELDDADVLIVGGGRVALRKALSLADYGARVRLAAPEFCPELEADQRFELLRRGFEDADIEGARLVVAATGDRALNSRVSALCRERGVPVNVVDYPGECSFIFPASSLIVITSGITMVLISSTFASSFFGACITGAFTPFPPRLFFPLKSSSRSLLASCSFL